MSKVRWILGETIETVRELVINGMITFNGKTITEIEANLQICLIP